MVNTNHQNDSTTLASSNLPRNSSRLSSLYNENLEKTTMLVIDTHARKSTPLGASFSSNATSTRSRDENPPWDVKPFDSNRDLDLAPCLSSICGWAPCCCCLYSGIDDLNNDYDSAENGEFDIRSKQRYNSFPVNKNTFLMIMLVFIDEISQSMWTGAIFSIYIFTQDYENNALIGYLEGIYSISCLLFSFPLSNLSKKWNLLNTVRLGGIAIVLYIIIMILLVRFISDPTTHPLLSYVTKESILKERNLQHSIINFSAIPIGLSGQVVNEKKNRTGELVLYFFPAMVVWGLATAVISGPVKNILTHSVPSNTRSQHFVFITLLQMMSKTVGPAIAILIFVSTNNEWKLSLLKVIITCGISIGFVVAIICFIFQEKWFLPKESEKNSEQAGDDVFVDEAMLSTIQQTGISTSESPKINENEGGMKTKTNIIDEVVSNDEVVIKNQQLFGFCSLSPFLYLVSNVLFNVGAGMTLPYFPVFFKNDVGMTPVSVLLIYTFQPLFILLMFLILSKCESFFSRIATLLFCRSFGAIFLFLLSKSNVWLDNKAGVIAIIFLLRGASVNSTSFVENALYDDIVPALHVGVWKKIDYLIPLAWVCSAIAGGIYADKNSHTGSFFVSAIIQCVGVLFLLLTSVLKSRNDATSNEIK